MKLFREWKSFLHGAEKCVKHKSSSSGSERARNQNTNPVRSRNPFIIQPQSDHNDVPKYTTFRFLLLASILCCGNLVPNLSFVQSDQKRIFCIVLQHELRSSKHVTLTCFQSVFLSNKICISNKINEEPTSG